MSLISSASVSGMNAAQVRLSVSANNVANAQTNGYQRQEVVQSTAPDGGTITNVIKTPQPNNPALEKDMVEQLSAKNQFLANLQMFKAQERALGKLLDTTA